jgi:hypothetical protein
VRTAGQAMQNLVVTFGSAALPANEATIHRAAVSSTLDDHTIPGAYNSSAFDEYTTYEPAPAYATIATFEIHSPSATMTTYPTHPTYNATPTYYSIPDAPMMYSYQSGIIPSSKTDNCLNCICLLDP